MHANIPCRDSFISATGALLVDGFPIGLGVDAAGVVVKAGENASTKFKVGDEVCGCTRLGSRDYSTAQEFFLMDSDVTIPKPKNITIQQAATIGVGAETACLGLFNGLDITLPSLDEVPEGEGQVVKQDKDEYIIILGGASSVGKYAIQLAVACGYKICTSCSAASADIVRDLIPVGAIFDYKKSIADQEKDVMDITEGKFCRVFDAVGSGSELAEALFAGLSKRQKDDNEKKYYFATTNPMANMAKLKDLKIYPISLGEVGRSDAKELNGDIAKFIPVIVGLIEHDKMSPSDYDIVGAGGFEDAIEALKYQQKGAGGSNKVVVKIQDK